MLQSMFPDPSEFVIDEGDVNVLNAFVINQDINLPCLEYCINLKNEKGKVTLHVALPVFYPNELPDIYVRSNELSRQTQLELNAELNLFLESLEKGDLVIGSIIAWLQERSDEFLMKDVNKLPLPVKRKDIKELSDEYQLTGFCLPGKPGIICVEGLLKNVNSWWHTVRSWNWQKILCKKHEENKVNLHEDIQTLRRFEKFRELGPDSNIRIKGSGFHVDMGDLFRYLEEHESGYMFEEFFGVSGK
ncbi:RWD domain-containing protein 2A [Armadillidium nasatum]|uniref:RWD domain-containing protein 2A n=1 Tax=Armadillidium nasatum TaxID=96803 RepID=A0A5N5TEF2_9CRUS|nr:RWD domain-containing protein 2A [Armadillidium nasatum]